MRKAVRGGRAILVTASLFFLLAFVFCPAGLCVEDMAVPVDLQFQLFMKILTFDRNLPSRAGDEVVFGIVYQSLHRASQNAREAFLKAAADSGEKDINGLPVRCVTIDLQENQSLEEAILKNGVDILYVAPLRAYDVESISSIGQQSKVLTLTGVPEYSRFNIAVSISSKAGKPEIVINLPATKAEGTDFSSKLLNLATVITGKGEGQ